MGIWSMQTCTAMQFPISMLGRKDDLGAAKHWVRKSQTTEPTPVLTPFFGWLSLLEETLTQNLTHQCLGSPITGTKAQ